MNTLDDLRSTLEQHSHDSGTLDAPARRSQLAGRIAAARRRRNAVRGGVALAAVVAVAGVVLVPPQGGRDGEPDQTEPANRTVLGMEAPTVLAAPDHTYRFTEAWSDPESSSLEVEINPASTTRILSWATAGADQGVRVQGPDDESWDSTSPDFQDWVAIPAGFEGPVTVTTNNPGATGVAAALYEAEVSALPDVVEGFHGQYFRADGPVARRLAAEVGAAGETELTFPYSGAGNHLAVEFSCEGVPADLWIHAEVGGAETSTQTDVCQSGTGKEGSTNRVADLGLVPGGYSSRDDGSDWPDAEARVWFSRSAKDRTPLDPAEHPNARLAAAVYVPKGPPVYDIAGVDVPHLTWQAGHLWELVASTMDATRPWPVDLSPRRTSGLVTVITQAGARDAMVTVTTLANGEQLDRSNFGITAGGAASGTVVLPLGTTRVEARVQPMPGEEGRGVRQHLAFYELVE